MTLKPGAVCAVSHISQAVSKFVFGDHLFNLRFLKTKGRPKINGLAFVCCGTY